RGRISEPEHKGESRNGLCKRRSQNNRQQPLCQRFRAGVGSYKGAFATSRILTVNLLEVVAQIRKLLHNQKSSRRLRGRYFFMLQNPCVAVRDEHCIETSRERRINVGLGAVANHPG